MSLQTQAIRPGDITEAIEGISDVHIELLDFGGGSGRTRIKWNERWGQERWLRYTKQEVPVNIHESKPEDLYRRHLVPVGL